MITGVNSLGRTETGGKKGEPKKRVDKCDACFEVACRRNIQVLCNKNKPTFHVIKIIFVMSVGPHRRLRKGKSFHFVRGSKQLQQWTDVTLYRGDQTFAPKEFSAAKFAEFILWMKPI